MNSRPFLNRHLLAAAITVAVAGCASQQARQPQQVTEAARYSGTTLADLEQTDITIEAQSLDNVTAENALESYRRAVELFQDPEKRSQSLRRMADLAMAAAEEKTVEQADAAAAAQASRSTATPRGNADEELDRDVDKMLYENFMREAQTTDNREEKYALLDLAGNVRTNLEGASLDTDYQTAIMLYKELLDTSTNPQERGEAYYLLAKAYALAGDLDASRRSLDALVKEYPNSPYYIEAQFRRGELLFSEGDFEFAAQAYGQVVKAGADNDFYSQAQYKLGWAQYKLGDYELALTQFFALVDALYKKPELDDPKTMESKTYGDTQRAISLAFSNLDGAESVKAWFNRYGHREYEKDVYRALGNVYLQQERFRDAALAFEAFVTVYPDSPLAPEFSTLSINAYDKGGFPTEVLPAKERFAEHYGIRSSYWQAHPDVREGYVPLLKGHLLDLAKYYHAQAQRSKQPADYDKPAAWYQEYLATPPTGPENVDINNLYAQSLFSAGRYARAVEEFERTAYKYGDVNADTSLSTEQKTQRISLNSEAAYMALVSYQNHIRSLPSKSEADKTQLAEWRNRRINSSLKFAATYPQHEKVPSVLYNIIEDQLANGDKEAAIKTAGVLVNRQPPPEEKLLVYGWATIANGEFDLGRFKVAEFGYTQLLNYPSVTPEERGKYQERLAASVYKQGEALQQNGELAAAAAMFMRVGQVYPDATIRKNAEFDAATLYLNLGDTAAAIPILEAFRKRYPNDPLNETIPDKLAVAYEKTGDFSAAALELETIADRYGESKDNQELARQALWQAAEMQDRAKQPDASVRLYRKYVQTYPTPYDFRAEAQFRLTGFYEQIGNTENREYWLKQLTQTYTDAGSDANDRVAWLGAWAAFSLAEPGYEEFVSIKLTQPLKKSLTAKTTAMKNALGQYEKVAAIGVSEFATAANFKIGEMYRVLAADMMASERPKGLDELELEQYDLLLEEQALPYEDQAIDILIANTDLVKDNIYGKWVKSSFAQLAELLPGRYAKFEQVEDYVDIIY